MVASGLKHAPDVLVFDMDGVLVEVSESYREAIRATVKHYTGELATHDEIQDFKNAGGWNNDWLLSQRLIADRGKKPDYTEIVEYFNHVFLGEDGDGLIRYEKWMPRKGLLEGLESAAKLAIFTGRAKYEADVTLERYAKGVRFEPLITDESVAKPKPAPDGLLLIEDQYPGKNIWYFGDTVDDARSAQAAGVTFIGVSTPHNPRHAEITELLRELDAVTVLSDINELEALVEAGRAG